MGLGALAVSGLSGLTLWRVFWRSLFLQAGFSPEAMQTLGLLYALAPALKQLYPEEARRQEAVRRHLTPFNTHPYSAAAIVGGILYYEVRVARGEAPPEAVTRFKATLMGPLAALGDGFFWLSLKPATGALGAMLVPFLGPWAALVFLVTYNLVHFTARGWLFRLGWQQGEGVVARLAAAKVPLWGTRLRALAAACAGALGVWVAVHAGGAASGLPRPVAGLVGLGVGALALELLDRRVSPTALLYGTAAAATAAGALW